ncbi:hypothetical protein NEF87_004821 [Candidatus Lokiarchaeum ossiferum]|uniref:histidine kinase n=1 Tax=Candidatus Lokiarchaeum ossiferum TaxID=2951803 RepID=A0ABY6HYC7_9ARCH|nr:hypothetical protein NEF87_004821 [Candidatus Lokiarchaeum sp. B-35]
MNTEWRLNNIDPSIFENMGSFVFIYSPKGKIHYANSLVSQRLGYSLNEIDRMWIYQFFFDEDNSKLIDLFCSPLIDGEIRSINKPLKKKNGKLVHIETWLSLVRKNSQEEPSILAVGREKTSRNAEEVLSERETEYHEERLMLGKIIENNPFAIAIFDAEGYYLHSNQAYKKMWECEPPDDYSIFTDPIIKSQGLLDGVNRAILNGDVYHSDDVYYNTHELNPNLPNKEMYIRATIFSIFDASGILKYPVFLYEDVTERKKAEIALSDYQDHLEATIHKRTQELEAKHFQLQEKIVNEQTISKIISRFTGEYNLESSIEKSLADLGKLYQAERVFLTHINWDNKTASTKYEWVSQKNLSILSSFSNVPYDEQKWWHRQLSEHNFINIPNCDLLPEDAQFERDLFKKGQIKAVFAYGIKRQNKIIAFVGINKPNPITEWSSSALTSVSIFAELISNIYEKDAIENALIQERWQLNNIIKYNPYAIIIFDKKLNFLRSNDALHQLIETDVGLDYSVYDDGNFKNRGQLNQWYQQLAAGKTLHIPEFNLNPKNTHPDLIDKNIILRAVAFPILSQNGELDSIVVMLEDISKQKNAEIALKKTKQYFQEVIENSLDISYRLNFKTNKYDYISPIAEKITGLQLQDVLVDEYYKHTNQKDLRRNQEELAEILKNSDSLAVSHTAEARFHCKDGKWIWLSDRFTYFRSEDGTPLYSIGTIRDITQKKEDELSLIEREHKFRQLVEHSPFPIVLLSRSNLVDYINPEFNITFGYSIDEIPTAEILFERTLSNMDYKKDMLYTFLHDTKGSMTRLIPPKRYLFLCKDSSVKKVILRLSILDSGLKYLIYEDITQSAEMMEKLSNSEMLYRSVVETSNELIFIQSIDEKIEFVNKATLNNLGYTKEEFMALNLGELIHPDDFKRVMSELNSLTNNISVNSLEYRVKKKNGRYLELSTNAVPLHDASGNITSFLGVARDITELNKVQKTLRERELQIQYSNVISMISSMLVPDSANTSTKIDGILRTLGNSIGGSFILIMKHNGHFHQNKYHIEGSWTASNYNLVPEQIEEFFSEGLLDTYAESVPLNIFATMNSAKFSPKLKILADKLDIASLLLLPVFIGKDRFGTMILNSSDIDREFSQREKSLCLNVAMLVGLGLKTQYDRQIINSFFDALSVLGVAIFILQETKSKQYKFYYANNYYCEMTGYSIEELLALDSYYDIFPENKEKIKIDFVEARKKKTPLPQQTHMQFQTKNGIEPKLVSLQYGKVENIPAIYGILFPPVMDEIMTAEGFYKKYHELYGNK